MDLLSQGLNLTLFGMGTVVTFLALLILVTRLMSFLVLRYEKIPDEIPLTASSAEADEEDHQLVAVIAVAVQQFKSRRAAAIRADQSAARSH
jgi:oxaloacetate decarboxylase gamma subunit